MKMVLAILLDRKQLYSLLFSPKTVGVGSRRILFSLCHWSHNGTMITLLTFNVISEGAFSPTSLVNAK